MSTFARSSLLILVALATVSACGASPPSEMTLRAAGSAAAPADRAQQLADFVMNHKLKGTESAASFVVTNVAKLEAAQPTQADALSAIADQHDAVMVVQITGNFVANHSLAPNSKRPTTVLVQLVYDTVTDRTLVIRYFDDPYASNGVPGRSSAAAAAAATARVANYVPLGRLGTPQPLRLSGH